MAKAIELRPPRRRPIPAGQAVGGEPPEGGPRPYGLSGDGPVLGTVRTPEQETQTLPETTLMLDVDFTGDQRR
ncbi:MAG: hypothetical protein U0359_20535 [Byssovorax sp.]